MRLAVLFCMLVGCSPVAAPAPHLATPEDLADKTVALVNVDNADGSVHAYCTGTWVGEHIIATALHCVNDMGPNEGVVYVNRADLFHGKDLHERPLDAHAAAILAVDNKHDLALLVSLGKEPPHKVATITNETVYQGEFVQTMGSPLGQMYSYSHGDVAAVRYRDALGGEETLFIQTTAPISPGNSGGALFNSSGELVGVCHATFSKSQNLNLFIHYQYVDALLRRSL